MIIHTSDPELTIQYLNELKLKYKEQIKSIKSNEQFQWYDLPEFKSDNILLKIKYYSVELPKEKREEFFKKFSIKITKNNYIHFKKQAKTYENYEYKITHAVNPRYPIYVISKSRYTKRYTTDALEDMNCPYKIVIERQEYAEYVKYIADEKILVLSEKIDANAGSIPARNFVWKHAVENGFKKHWILDDNLNGFYRWHYNVKKKVKSGVVFRVIEDYCDRYSNIGMSGMNYVSIVPAISINRTMLTLNTRIYSCILINNELLDNVLTERWRGRYNEDTDLSLRCMYANTSTVLFDNFLANKLTSGIMKGGNTDIMYKGGSHDGYQAKYDELKNNWPNIVKLIIKHKDKRPHHHINYRKHFQHLKLKPNFMETIEKKPHNNYNMEFINV